MTDYVPLLIIFVFSLTTVGMILIQSRNHRENLKILEKMNQDLLNRIMAGDIQTYKMLTGMTYQEHHSSNFSDPVIYSDEAEARRLVEVHGLGEPLFDDSTYDDQEELEQMKRELFGG